jgi:predicted component of type VI protein secretion system
MKTDLYTKIVLTVIAVALTVNLFKGSISPAMADNKRYVNVPVNADGSLNVTITKSDAPLKVDINYIDPYAFRYVQAIKVKLDR